MSSRVKRSYKAEHACRKAMAVVVQVPVRERRHLETHRPADTPLRKHEFDR